MNRCAKIETEKPLDVKVEKCARIEVPKPIEVILNQGAKGEDGLSAYEIAVKDGYVGTEEEWLLSLVGPKGKDGIDGKDGYTPIKGKDYFDGERGPQGEQGPAGLDGATGPAGPQGEQGIQGLTGKSGVYVGDEQPTDEETNVWIDTDEQPTIEYATKQYVDEKIGNIDLLLQDIDTGNGV